MKRLTVRQVTADEHGLFRAIYSLYLHDLTEFTDFYTLGRDGQWSPDYLPTWLDQSNPNVHPFLFFLDEIPIGMALVGAKPFPYMSSDADYRVNEFFIARRHRHHGLGRLAAERLFEMLPGKWEIVQLPENNAATAFWLSVVDKFTGGRFQSDRLDDEPRQVFVSDPAARHPPNVAESRIVSE